MNQLLLGLGAGLASLILLASTTANRQDAARIENPKIAVGTFDSRAIAVAYAHSDRFDAWIRELRADAEAAEAAGDQEAADALAARGMAQQERFHRQAFGAASVADILVHIEDRLPEIAKEADVDAIVSKWDLTWRDRSAKFVDLTDAMVDEFDPDEQVLGIVEGLRGQDPIPLEELEGHEH